MVTQIDPISTPPTPADTPAAFEEKASQVWADLHKAVPQMNRQAQDIDAIGQAADAAKHSAQQDSDAALGSRNEANAAKTAAQSHAGSAAQSSAAADAARGVAEAAAGNAGTSAGRAETAAKAAESVVANAVQQTSPTGVALLPEGANAQRPAEGSIPAGHLAVRGNTQNPDDYWAEFWDRAASKWRVFADRTWVGQQIDTTVQFVKDWVNQQVGFTIIYPNGGSAASPAFVSINSRYVLPNPFPGFNVICVAEVRYDGIWGETGWMYSTGEGGRGVKASQSSTQGVIVQTGRTHLLSGSMDMGGIFAGASPWNAPLECRVKVWKVKGAV